MTLAEAEIVGFQMVPAFRKTKATWHRPIREWQRKLLALAGTTGI